MDSGETLVFKNALKPCHALNEKAHKLKRSLAASLIILSPQIQSARS